MPNVDGKQFGYGPKGKKAAKKYAKKHGLKVKYKDNPGYYAESKTEVSTYERIYNLLTEASRVRYERPESYGRTRGRKEYGTPGRRGRLTGKTASEMRAYGAGQDAARLFAHAKEKRKAASEIAAGPTVPSAPAAVRALKSGAKHAEERAKKKIAQGREAVKRKRKRK